MYNLIVHQHPWNVQPHSISPSRFLTHTREDLGSRFGPNFDSNLLELLSLPTLFVQETQGDQNQHARVGVVRRLYLEDGDIQIHYEFDSHIPPIKNLDLANYAGELGIDISGRWSGELGTTHWAIKDVNLPLVLLRHISPPRRSPTVFSLPDYPIIKQNLVSVMIPFDSKFDPVFNALVEASKMGKFNCERADANSNYSSKGVVMEEVVELIDNSHVVICDLSGLNANVCYEAGIAHALGKKIILIAQDDVKIPFDVRHHRFHRYTNTQEGLIKLTDLMHSKIYETAWGEPPPPQTPDPFSFI